MYVYVYVYVYIYTYVYISLSLSLYIYIYMYIEEGLVSFAGETMNDNNHDNTYNTNATIISY